MPFDLKTLKILPPEPDAPKAQAFRVRTENGTVYYAYQYPHPAVAATVVLRDLSRNAFLVIERANEPYRGYYAFPGGFLDVGKEHIEETAARELFEEAGVRVDPEALILIDVRSAPDRDPRDHVFDIAYYIEVESARAKALDEASGYRWVTSRELDADLPLAFDHDELWRNTKKRVRLTP